MNPKTRGKVPETGKKPSRFGNSGNNRNTRTTPVPKINLSGLKFPKLDLFPQFKTTQQEKSNNMRTKETDSREKSDERKPMDGNRETQIRAQRYRAKSRKPVNNNRSKTMSPPIRPTPVLTMEKIDSEEDIFTIDLMSGLVPDEAGLITVTHRLFTRTRDQYEETLTSLSEVNWSA